MASDKRETARKWYHANKEKHSILNKQHKEKHKEKLKEYAKEYKEKNNDILKEYDKQYYQENKERLKSIKKEWFKNNPNYVAQYSKNRYNNDPLFKLKNNIRTSINSALRRKHVVKKNSTEGILGCTVEEFKQYLESKFEPWMNWSNKASTIVEELNTYWDIDHIIPVDSAQNEEDVVRLNHYTNFQPLCAYNNRWVKRNK